MRRIRLGTGMCAALLLVSCGGGGGGGGGAPPVASAPTPSPTPSPSATPVTATARVYATSAATGVLEFTTGDIDTFGDYLALGFTSRDGQYFAGYANAIARYVGRGGAPGASLSADYADRFKRSQVVDHETAAMIELNAPASVRMVTPVTAMLVAPGATADKTKVQLGITGSLFGMVKDPDLATYDAVVEAASGDPDRAADGARMHAATLRVLAITTGLAAIASPGAYLVPDAAFTLGDVSNGGPVNAPAAKCLSAAPARFVFQNDRMIDVVRCYAGNFPSIPMSDTKAQAVAHLIDVYAAAIPVRLETQDDKARWLLGLQGYLRPMVGQVLSATDDNAALAALAVTLDTVRTATGRYAEHYRYNDSGLFMPAPDFLVLAGKTTLNLTTIAMTGNDRVFSNETANTRGIDFSEGTISSVTVPAINATQIAVTTAADGSYTLTVSSGFTGVSYFDYVSRAKNGEERTARVYVRVL